MEAGEPLFRRKLEVSEQLYWRDTPVVLMMRSKFVFFKALRIASLLTGVSIRTLDFSSRSRSVHRLCPSGTGPQASAIIIASPPVTGDDLPHSVFTRKKKRVFNFEGCSGMTVYFCLRYENEKGEAGPYGPIFSAVIP